MAHIKPKTCTRVLQRVKRYHSVGRLDIGGTRFRERTERPHPLTVVPVFVNMDEKISELVREHFDLRPKGLIEMLDLKRPIYLKTAAYGHFGREDPDFTWENTDKADALKAAL